jgi:23S rRNA pseudouridine2605 synthase
MRIQKFIAESGVCSRRAAEELIRSGKITVNGKPAQIGMDVDELTDSVYCDGKRIRPRAAEKRYFIFYKPRGVITAMKAQDDRSVVADLIKGIKGRVYPVGRLDRDSEGLLILTDDGDLAQRLTHPSYSVSKTYRVTVRGEVSSDQVDRFRAGVVLDDGEQTQPAGVQIHKQGEGKTVLHVTITEGKNREIRRICESVGVYITKLKRISLGPLRLGDLKPGEFRELNSSELRALKNMAYGKKGSK